jgi:hypothetical protein
MSLALLMALSLMTANPGAHGAAYLRHQPSDQAQPAPVETEDVPPNAPTDDYGFVSWCYGATDEYLGIYPKILPDLKDIDKQFGSPVKEDQPYAKDVAAERLAAKRFADAMAAAEKANPQIHNQGQADVATGRSVWSQAEALPERKLADAWLFWGIPVRCETTAKRLKAHPAVAAATQPATQ